MEYRIVLILNGHQLSELQFLFKMYNGLGPTEGLNIYKGAAYITGMYKKFNEKLQ